MRGGGGVPHFSTGASAMLTEGKDPLSCKSKALAAPRPRLAFSPARGERAKEPCARCFGRASLPLWERKDFRELRPFAKSLLEIQETGFLVSSRVHRGHLARGESPTPALLSSLALAQRAALPALGE